MYERLIVGRICFEKTNLNFPFLFSRYEMNYFPLFTIGKIDIWELGQHVALRYGITSQKQKRNTIMTLLLL
jgi:hypothetical protein